MRQNTGTPTSRTRRARRQRAGRRGSVIVVGYDGSSESRAALDHAAARVGARGRLLVVHVVEEEPQLGSLAEEVYGHALLEGLVRDDCTPLLDTDFERLVTAGRSAKALADIAREEDADEIVIGAPKVVRSGISTADELLRLTSRPVTVVPLSAQRP